MATEEATKLNEMYRNIGDQSDDLANNISQLEDLRDELNEQINAVETALLDVAANRLITFLFGKALSLQNGYTYRGLWEVGTIYNTNETIVISPDSSYPSGDSTSITPIDSTSYNNIHYQAIQDSTSTMATYPVTSPLYWTSIPYNVTTYRVLLRGGFNSTNLTAWAVQIRSFVPPVPPAPGTYVWTDVYSLSVGWDSNTQVTELISDWNYAYDLLTKALGLDGTYGLIAKRNNLNNAINLLTINKNKIEGGLNVFPSYIP